jgi:transposase InsO family protein
VRFAFVAVEKANYPIEILCRVLQVSRSGYYAWARRPPSTRSRQDARLAVEVAVAHKRSRGSYGSPRVYHELRARGMRHGRKRIERLMREQGLQARRKRRFRKTTDSRHSFPTARNVLARNFMVDRADAVWVGDITYVWTGEGWLYLAALLDLFSRRVVGWAVRETLETALALEALDRALATRRPAPGLLHHTDRGCQYASHAYAARLGANGISASMSRVGDCWDNAVAESFFATLKGELVDLVEFRTRAEAIAALADYIENFYNCQRRHSSLGYCSPVEFELRAQITQLAA